MPKKGYRVRNWKEYNKALVERGNITFWFEEAAIKKWYSPKTNQRGRPKKYSDKAMLCGLTLKAVFNLTFRAVEGFIKSLIKSLQLDIETPDYTLLCKRQKGLSIKLDKRRIKAGEKIQVVVDSTGLKVYGEGEWKVRQHGYAKHRLWRKLHLAVNSETQEIEACELSELGRQDCEGFALLVNQIKRPIDTAIGDGAFDRFSCYELAEKKQIKLVAPPQHNARTSSERRSNKHKACEAAVRKRDNVIQAVRQQGPQRWKTQVGYHRRSLAETAVFRIKTLVGNRLRTKTLWHQKTEAAIWCNIINKMTKLGMPKSVAIGL